MAERHLTPAQRKELAEERHLNLQSEGLERERRVFAARTLWFDKSIDDLDLEPFVEQLWDFRLASKEPVTIKITSPGGSVWEELMFFDILKEMRADGIHVTTHVMGMAASAASTISQAGTTRVISPNAWFMVHEPATFTFGKAGDIKRESQLLEKLHDQTCGILAERSNLTKAEIKRRTQDKDWWMPAAEALKHGFFDEMK